MKQSNECLPAFDLGASVASIEAQAELDSMVVRNMVDDERLEVGSAMLEDFRVIEELTGWPRSAMPSLLGCKNPNPIDWLEADLGILMHSQSVVHLMREVAEVVTAEDPTVRTASLRELTSTATDEEVIAMAQRDMSRSALGVCRELLQRARGSSFAVRRAIEDGHILELIAQDLSSKATLTGLELLRPRALTTSQIEVRLGLIALVDSESEIATDPT